MNFPKLMKDTETQFEEAQRTLSRINTTKSVLRHITSKLQKTKHREELKNLQKKKKILSKEGQTKTTMLHFLLKTMHEKRMV